MTGILVSNDYANYTGQVDTRNDNIGIITMYYPQSGIPNNAIVGSTVSFKLMIHQRNNYYGVFENVVPRNVAMFNTEDRDQWYRVGEKSEADFVNYINPRVYNRVIRINPEKKDDPTVIDLVDTSSDDGYADLKTQTTPFFSCETNPHYFYRGNRYIATYTVTFNLKDYENYCRTHPHCNIYFWVNWQQLEYAYRDGSIVRVQPLQGVWVAKFQKLRELIENREVALHAYQNRKTDDHNAKESYLFMLNDQEVFVRLV